MGVLIEEGWRRNRGREKGMREERYAQSEGKGARNWVYGETTYFPI